MRKPFLAVLLLAIIFISSLLTDLNLDTASGDSGCDDGVCDVALVCNDIEVTNICDTVIDTPLRNHLVELGHDITDKDDNDQSWDPTVFDVVVISDSADSPKINWLKDKGVGILTMDALPNINSNRLCLASTGIDDKPPLQYINVVNNTHYITQGFCPLGVPCELLVGDGQALSGGVMEGWGGDVQSLAHYPEKQSSSTLLAIDKSGTLTSFGGGVCPSASLAADRRVFFGARLFQNLNSNGRQVFDRAFEWVAYLDGAGGGAASSGSLESSTFDTGVSDGVAYNSIMWLGSAGSGGATVKFQLATANCSDGATNPPTCSPGAGWGGAKTNGDGAFTGPDGTSATFYTPSAPGVPAAISTLYHNNERYFRYKIFLDKSGSETSPVVTDVIINWSP